MDWPTEGLARGQRREQAWKMATLRNYQKWETWIEVEEQEVKHLFDLFGGDILVLKGLMARECEGSFAGFP